MSKPHLDRWQCGRAPFSCGRGFDAREYNRRAGLCHACAERAARRLRVLPQDLPLALFAFSHAQAGRPDHVPTVEDVWVVIEQANRTLPEGLRVRQQPKYIPIPRPNPHAPADSSLPEGDRVAA
jgi:hypothetical protein